MKRHNSVGRMATGLMAILLGAGPTMHRTSSGRESKGTHGHGKNHANQKKRRNRMKK